MKNGNGGSTPKIALPSNEQDEIRRDTKSRRRSHGHRTLVTNDGYLTGLRDDRLVERGSVMLDRLCELLTSTSPTAADQLRWVTSRYVEAFVDSQEFGGKARHQAAKAIALKEVTGNLRSFAETQLDRVERETRPTLVGA